MHQHSGPLDLTLLGLMVHLDQGAARPAPSPRLSAVDALGSGEAARSSATIGAVDFDLRQRTIELEVNRSRLERALGSCELALAELRQRGDVTGLQRLRDDLRSALRLVQEGTNGDVTGSGGGRGPRTASPRPPRRTADGHSPPGAAAQAA